MPRPLFALLLVLGVLAPVRAAPLATLAPAESFAVLGWQGLPRVRGRSASPPT